MYRITTVPMARRAMEEVMRAVKAEDTKPLAFLGFANTYRDDPSPYIIDVLIKLAMRNAEYIPGVAAQLLAVAMKEADVKRAVNEYYKEKVFRVKKYGMELRVSRRHLQRSCT